MTLYIIGIVVQQVLGSCREKMSKVSLAGVSLKAGNNYGHCWADKGWHREEKRVIRK